MTGLAWLVSDLLDEEDLQFMRKEFITYGMGVQYYDIPLKSFTRLAHEAGAVYKLGKEVRIKREILEKYMRDETRTIEIQARRDELASSLINENNLRRCLRPKEACKVYSVGIKKLRDIARRSGAMYKIDNVLLIDCEVIDRYLKKFEVK